ncbi:ATP-dependent DNA helicase PIF1 [Tanacetum coccineum]
MDKETSKDIDEQIVRDLISMLDQYSSVSQAFRMARDWCNTHSSADFRLRLHIERKTTRQYNAPTVSEVAVIIINDFGDAHPIRDIVVDRKDTRPQQVSELHPSYMALQYPLLFSYGEEQYLVDAYTTVEEQRLKWTRNNQDMLRIDMYHNLCDVVTRGDTSALGLGKRIVLPRTFTGSLRPEIGTRVFKRKLTELLDDLTKKNMFGESSAVVYVIEFQKRGLPHAHILLWLEEHCKCKTPSDIDDIILVEMPSPTDDPDGYKVVTDYMLHGPCGKNARNAACTNDGKCSKKFPNPFLGETFLDEDRYPHYRRRDNKIKGYQILIKYLKKGPDRAKIVIKENVKNGTTLGTENVLEVDEIKNYLNCQFLAPCEAVWWLFSFDIYYAYPSVIHLSFHLPNQNAITLWDSERLPALLQREGIDVTMFTGWFELNKRDPEARTLTYADIPKHYVWHEQSKL